MFIDRLNQINPNTKFIMLCFGVFLGFLCIGIPLPILPEFIHHNLGMTMFIAGVGVGLQSLVTVITRRFAGQYADTVGAREATRRGFLICSLAAILYFISALASTSPVVALIALFAGRITLGMGESFMLTGILTWGIEILGPSQSGKVMSWNGIAMYGAIAIGAPIGLWSYSKLSFLGVAGIVLLLPMIGFLIASSFTHARVAASSKEKPSFVNTVKKIWSYGLGFALGGVGFGALSAFIALVFKSKEWENSGYALLIFGFCYIGVRLVAGHLPDKTGGRSVAIVSLALEIIGQICLWTAETPSTAFIGVALTGIGFSLLFPAFGVQALKEVTPESKGTALGAFSAFFDIALGLTAPICGLIIEGSRIQNIYLFGALASLIAFFMATRKKESCCS